MMGPVSDTQVKGSRHVGMNNVQFQVWIMWSVASWKLCPVRNSDSSHQWEPPQETEPETHPHRRVGAERQAPSDGEDVCGSLLQRQQSGDLVARAGPSTLHSRRRWFLNEKQASDWLHREILDLWIFHNN